MQLADELPMIYTVFIMCYATFSYKRSPRTQILIALVMIGLGIFITVCDITIRSLSEARTNANS